MIKKISGVLLSLAVMALSLPALADGIPTAWQLGFQRPATPVMERLFHLHNAITVLIVIITVFVLALLVIICVRFNAKANPVASKTTHHTMLEIIWTVVPIVILVGIALPSLRLHYFMGEVPKAEMTLKVVGHQWYWEYAYPDSGFGFESRPDCGQGHQARARPDPPAFGG